MKFLLFLMTIVFVAPVFAQERVNVLAIDGNPVEMNPELIGDFDQRLSVACVNRDANELSNLFSQRIQEIRIKQGDFLHLISRINL